MSDGKMYTAQVRRRRWSSCLLAFLPVVCLHTAREAGRAEDAAPAGRPLIIAFASLRERPAFSNLYVYRHDGVSAGKIIGSIPGAFERADSHPSLSAGGAVCAYASKQVGGFSPLIHLWDVKASRAIQGPPFNAEFGTRIEPTLSARGDLLAFGGWDQPNAPGGWDVFLYDLKSGAFIDLPGLNSTDDEREATLSRDGRLVAFVSTRPGGNGLSDVHLYDRQAKALVPLPGLNSPHRELNPTLSDDGRIIAFVSDRPGGAGGKDVYIYDRETARLVDVPGLNSIAHEQTPALSPDGRYVAFVSERTSGSGERDVYLYDRRVSSLLPLPGLNSKQEDFDPSLAFEEPAEDGMME